MRDDDRARRRYAMGFKAGLAAAERRQEREIGQMIRALQIEANIEAEPIGTDYGGLAFQRPEGQTLH
jgi:hypothetical protein